LPIEPVSKIWMNGALVPWEDARIHVLSHALHYGTGVFEGMRAYETDRGPAVFRLGDHLRRLGRSAHIYKIRLPYSIQEMAAASKEVIAANDLPSCYIRPLVFLGYGEMGVSLSAARPDVVIAAWPWTAYLGEDSVEQGVRVKISSWRRHDPNIVPPAAKSTGQYLNSALAKSDAIDEGYDEAIMLNPWGLIADGSGENVFIVRDGILMTPPEQAGVLSGITRDSVIRIARDLGYEVQERNLTRTDLYTAEEGFLTGTAAEIVPIREVDDRPLAAGGRGPTTKDIQQVFFDAVHGRDPRYAAWNEHVRAE
jgi:branched-chain amino acid aminotransferase